MPKVLIIFSGAGLIVHLNEGAKHRLNCYIITLKLAVSTRKTVSIL